jgi:hypothetical protein
MHKPKWLAEGLKDEKSIDNKWRPFGSKGLPEAHLTSEFKSQNSVPKSKEVMENLHGHEK